MIGLCQEADKDHSVPRGRQGSACVRRPTKISLCQKGRQRMCLENRQGTVRAMRLDTEQKANRELFVP
jgi:hypothetical protein